MANRAMLLGGSSKDVDCDNILAAGSYCIPLFWFTLYSPEDIVSKKIEMEDGTFELCPTLIVDYKVAKTRIVTRKPQVFAIIPQAYSDLYDKWILFISKIEATYLQIDMLEIWMMADDLNVFYENLKKALHVFVDPNPENINRLLNEYVGIKVKKKLFTKEIIYPENEEQIISLLCGYSWVRDVPWEK